MPDLLAALIAYLKLRGEVRALVETNIFGEEIPDSFVVSMPAACVVLAYGGGAGAIGSSGQAYGDMRVDTRAFGATAHEAAQVWMAVHVALKELTRQVVSECLIHWAKPAGGPMPMRDPDRTWPYMWASWQVLSAEIAA